MSLSIKNAETERLARQLADLTGESITRAVAIAVTERLDRVQRDSPAGAAERRRRIGEIAGDASQRWVEPYRSWDHGEPLYDERGLPR